MKLKIWITAGIASMSLAAGSQQIEIAMKSCSAGRPPRTNIEIKNNNPIITQKPDFQLVWKGGITVDSESFDIYLPKAPAYSIKNTAKDDGDLYNTSTLISIDSNHDGRLTADEGWFANLPVRIGDRMFDVIRIAPNGRSIILKSSAKPLSGVIVGRRMPPFAYKTRDGKAITENTFKGKALLIDVWSVT